MLVRAKVCDLTEDLLWFVCGLYNVFPNISGMTEKSLNYP